MGADERGDASLQVEVLIEPGAEMAIDREDVARAVRSALRAEGVSEGTVTVLLTDDERIRELHRRYMGVDTPTDVLSFGARAEDSSFVLPPEAASYLGDVVISVPCAAWRAAQEGHSLAMELRVLAIHGVLHLLGYDDRTETERAAMWKRQDEILKELPPLP